MSHCIRSVVGQVAVIQCAPPEHHWMTEFPVPAPLDEDSPEAVACPRCHKTGTLSADALGGLALLMPQTETWSGVVGVAIV